MIFSRPLARVPQLARPGAYMRLVRVVERASFYASTRPALLRYASVRVTEHQLEVARCNEARGGSFDTRVRVLRRALLAARYHVRRAWLDDGRCVTQSYQCPSSSRRILRLLYTLSLTPVEAHRALERAAFIEQKLTGDVSDPLLGARRRESRAEWCAMALKDALMFASLGGLSLDAIEPPVASWQRRAAFGEEFSRSLATATADA